MKLFCKTHTANPHSLIIFTWEKELGNLWSYTKTFNKTRIIIVTQQRSYDIRLVNSRAIQKSLKYPHTGF